MSEAALTEDAELNNDLDQEQESVEVKQTESAPVAEEKPAEDGVQKRINKITADKYAQQRRADELQRQLDEMQAKPKPADKAPTLEDFDHDEDAFNAANIKHQVSLAVAEQAKSAQREAELASARKAQESFNEQITALGKDDFADKANAIPLLPNGVADALMQSENGAELIYHLGGHLDVADKLAGMSPHAAMIEIGRISAQMSVKPEVKHSAAPDPIEPISSGGSISAERGPKGARFE